MATISRWTWAAPHRRTSLLTPSSGVWISPFAAADTNPHSFLTFLYARDPLPKHLLCMEGSMAKRKIYLATASIAAFVSLGAWAVLRGNSDPQYRTAPVTRGNVAYAVSATGSPNAVVTVQVGSQVSGNIIALYADFNTKVTKDQVVARIDPQIFQARVDQAKAALNANQA